jgi:hypothetical protein
MDVINEQNTFSKKKPEWKMKSGDTGTDEGKTLK